MDDPLKYFSELRDPRIDRSREHLPEKILSIAIAAVLSGAESWNDIAGYLLKQEKPFKRGIKSKRLKAAWNHPCLLKLLGGYASPLSWGAVRIPPSSNTVWTHPKGMPLEFVTHYARPDRNSDL